MSNILFILNDGPYGTERSYNGVRLAGAIAKRASDDVRIFLMGDAAVCAKRGQKVPQGYYNLELMFGPVIRREGQIGVCGTCMDARGMTEEELAEGTHRGTLEELTDWTLWADKVMVF